MADINVSSRLDLRSVACPENYVRTILALEELEPGQVLMVILQGEEAVGNVPRSLGQDGHCILSADSCGKDGLILCIRKAG